MQTEIERLLGTPYSKIDCSGFVAEVYQNSMNYKLPHSSQKMFKIGKKISEKSLRFGDLVFFKGRFGKEISHVGIYIGSSKFAHSSTSEGVTYNYLHEDYYKKRYVGAKRVLKN
ncbi:C40 family peptidase [bacterium]|nr:C40 family peptidase [bacterium]